MGIAISPVPIAAVILALLSARARVNGPAFSFGWVAGVATVTVIVLALPGAEAGERTPGDRTGWTKLALGLALLALAARQWRGRPGPGSLARSPGWMDRIGDMGPATAFGLGVLLSAANPKNLVLAAAGGVTIGAASLSVGEAAITVAVFVAVAASTVVVPVVAYLMAGGRLDEALGATKDWLIRNNATVMALLFVVFGFSLVGDGVQILGR